VKIEPSGRLAKLPLIELPEVLLSAVNTVPCVSGLFAIGVKPNCAPLSIVTPLIVSVPAKQIDGKA
jgi:hypothetical protein